MSNTAVFNNEYFLRGIKLRQFTGLETNQREYAVIVPSENVDDFCVCGSDIEDLAVKFNTFIESIIANLAIYESPRPRVCYATIKFKHSECKGMDKLFRKEFKSVGKNCHIEKRENDDGQTFTYTIKYRSNKYRITSISTDLREAKTKFVEMTSSKNIGKYAVLD